MAAWGGPDVRSMDGDEEAKMFIVTNIAGIANAVQVTL